MKLSKLLMLAFSVFLIIALLVACGKNSPEPVSGASELNSSSIQETTVLIETTPDGGTVEQDSEGNIITKDSSGKVTKVEDKNGNAVDVNNYLSDHPWVSAPKNSGDTSSKGNGSSGSSDGSGNTGSSSSDDSGDNSEDDPQDAESGDIEGDIPVIRATLPADDSSLVELPDL